VGSLKDGKDFICPYCDQPVKTMQIDPSAMCEKMLRAGSEGKQIEEALKDCDENNYGVCISCGKKYFDSTSNKTSNGRTVYSVCPQGHKTGKKKSTYA